jgi:hypothetical protein
MHDGFPQKEEKRSESMTSGSITLNGVTDKEMGRIFDFKAAHEGQFYLKEGTQGPGQNPQGGQFNNVSLTWNNGQGLKLILELVSSLQLVS